MRWYDRYGTRCGEQLGGYRHFRCHRDVRWQAPELSPEQLAQLEVIPPARSLWKAGVEEGQVAVFLPVFENGTVYVASTDGLLVRFNATTGKASGVIDTKHKLSGGVGTGEGLLLVGTFKGEVLMRKAVTGYGKHRYPPRC